MWRGDFLGSSSAIAGVYHERSLSAWDHRYWSFMDFTWEVPAARQRLLCSSLNSGIVPFQSPHPLAVARVPNSAVEKYDRYFDTDAFPQLKSCTFDSAPRVLSTPRGPFIKNADASLIKQFWRTKDERVYPQVSLNAYNATNGVTFGDPDMTFGSRSATLAAELHF